MDIEKVYSDLKTKFPNLEIYKNHPLAPYTTVKIGGPADIFIQTQSSEEFLKLLKYLNNSPLLRGDMAKPREVLTPITILGNGSNILISDSGLRGIIIKNDSEEIEILPDNKIKVSSGTQLSSLITYSLDHNLLGLEEFAYIPSTVGGAIAGNIHGNKKNNFSKFVFSVEKYEDFIISAFIKLTPGDSTQAKIEVQEIIQKKSQIQSMLSLGSVFKNSPGKDPAGMIIDQQLNLKGYSIGGAQISPTHGNFIINTGSATAKDYLALINLIQSQMQTKFGFQFELEIKLLGEF
ncbi:MAG: FAD-binding protein [Candidatus Shapirobacteria bacterium]|jgi:UDP-N-acetylmuramate dehydrogenase